MNRTRILAVIISVVVGIVFLASIGATANGLSERIDESDQRAAEAATVAETKDAQLADQQAKTALAVEQLRDHGIKPSVTATIPIPDAAPTPAVLMLYVKQALDAFCADGRCTPKPAKNGTDGTDGAPGRGISAVSCTTDGLIVTYTDGTTQNAGQCRGADGKDAGQPDPEPDPEPDPKGPLGN